MRLAEEIVLLLLNEDSGYFEPIPSWDLSCVFAGAVLADLALENRIDTDLESLILLDASPTGDDLLDPVLEEIASTSESRNAQYWVGKVAPRSEGIMESVLDRLVEQDILEYDQGGFWSLSRSVSRTRKYPSKEGAVRAEVRSRILRTLFEEDIPDPRDIILIGLAHTCNALRFLMTSEDYEEVSDRIELISKMDLITRTIATAVRGICLQPPPMRYASSKPVPKIGIWDIVKNRKARRHIWAGSIAKLMAEIYRSHGGVVELKMPFSKQRLVIIVGHETNQWFNRKGRNYLRTKDYIWDLEHVFGASRTLPGMDGAEHFRLRKSLKSGYSRASLEGKLDQLFFHCRTSLQDWTPGVELPGTEVCRTLMSRQVSHLAVGVDSSEYIKDVLDYQHRALAVRIQHALPEFALNTPSMKKKRIRLLELLAKIHHQHTPGLRLNQETDLVDEFLRVHADDPQFLPQTDLNFYFLATLIASIYLGSGLAFALSTMTSHPEIYAKIKAEGDALFGKDDPTAGDITPQAVDTAYRLFMETQRLFPVIPVQLRHVMNSCVIQGHEIPADTRLIVATTGAHYLEENFSDPLKFDIDRFLPEREEHLKLGAYAPFGLGTHKCLGSRWVDLQMVMNILLIAHHFELEATPSSYDLRLNPIPTNAPRKNFRIHVTGVRHRLPELEAS